MPSLLTPGSGGDSQLHAWAGECLAVGLPGEELDDASAHLLTSLGAGTVILFARNTADALQTRRLTDQVQALAAREGRPPLLVCADQEGGRVQRLRQGATELPSAMLLGRAGPDHVRAVSAVAAAELLAAGITFVLAPVADVNVEPENPIIGNRAFGAEPGPVGACVAAAVEGYRPAGVVTCVKHFPGHGDTRVDSHLGMPTLDRTGAGLDAVELPPFRAAIAAGVDAVMVGHLAVPALDPTGTPASLSPPLTDGLLRSGLGWRGLVCTDDLEMGGVAEGRSPGEIAVQAMAAGCDLLFFSHHPDRAREASAALADATLSRRLPVDRLQQAAARVRAVRARARRVPAAGPALADVGSAAHQRIVEAAARAGVQWARQAPASWGARRPGVVSIDDGRSTQAESATVGDPFLGCARLRGLQVEALAELEEGEGPLLVAVRRPGADLVERLQRLAQRRPVTVVALAEPWVLDRLPAAGAIAACDSTRAACDRALDLALG